MTMDTKKDVFQEHLSDYLKANKEGKGEILDAVCLVTKLHRKAAVRKFRRLQLHDTGTPERRGRRVYYTNEVTAALRFVWEAANEICGELLHPVISEYVTTLERDKLWVHGDEATGKLLAMSEGTVKARVGEFMKARKRRGGMSTTSPSKLKHIIPIATGPWEDAVPGEGQIDTVAHCGNSMMGDFIYTVNYTDMATYWVIPRAQWNKGQEATLENIKTIRQSLPFPLLGLHPDSGSEFVNWLAKDWCDAEHIALTRSRPNKKNDNCFVEERNGHIVRKFLGYTRLDTKETVDVVNALYDVLAVYLNHFIPSRRTKEKVRIRAKYKRTYAKAMTPYTRALAHSKIPEEIKAKLRIAHESLNPLLLKREVDTLIAKIFAKQKRCGDPGIQSSVR